MNEVPEPASSDTAATIAVPGRRLSVGDKLAERFVIVRFLAQGGMGEVYEAADLHLQGQHHALKTLRPDVANEPAFRQRFEREVLLARDVNHPNVCPTYDLFQVHDSSGPLTFLTMKLLRGESLQARLVRAGRMNAESVRPIARQMAAALDAAHQRGVVHRDFKPGNVMLEGAGQDVHVSITDFGLARAFASDVTLAEAGQLLGTPGYIAPEVIQGSVASYQSDVYAFGVALYVMLTGTKPVGNPSVMPPSQTAPETPPVWDRIVTGCLEASPEKRFRSAGEALALLDANPDAGVRRSSPARLSRRTAAVAGVAIATAAVLGVLFGRTLFDDVVHPLPHKRFVALMSWPMEANSPNLPLVRRTIDAVGSRLARAEATTSELMIISPGDVASQPSLKAPTDVVRTLGANLALTASITSDTGGLRLTLALLDAVTAKQLRRRSRLIRESDVAQIEDVATASAAEMLGVQLQNRRWNDSDELTLVPARVFQSFAAAEDLASQPNDTGLDRAVQAYQKVVEADANFALAYARLSQAYARKYVASKDRALLTLADRNADIALRLNKDSMNGLLSRAVVDLYFGKTDSALDGLQRALDLDPGNPQILLARARAFRTLNRGADEIQVYREIIRMRPNFWPAYDQLGLSLYRQANYRAAADAFSEGLVIAPGIGRLLNNLGAMQMLLKQRREAADTYRRSIAVAPTATAYQNLGTLAFLDHDYRSALDFYRQASDLNPKDDVVWRNIADTYALLGDAPHVSENYQKAASLVSESLKINPKRAELWVTLAMYEAKLGHRAAAEDALHHADQLGATGMPSQFRKVQALALLGRREEALLLLLNCLSSGQSLEDVELAIDLGDLRRDPRYVRAVAALRGAAEHQEER